MRARTTDEGFFFYGAQEGDAGEDGALSRMGSTGPPAVKRGRLIKLSVQAAATRGCVCAGVRGVYARAGGGSREGD